MPSFEAFTNEGRIIIKRKSGKKYQLGMSGCPAIDSQNRLIGVLVKGADDDGEKVYLEPAVAL